MESWIKGICYHRTISCSSECMCHPEALLCWLDLNVVSVIDMPKLRTCILYTRSAFLSGKTSARPYGLPARLEWSSNIVLRSKTCAGPVFWYLPDAEPSPKTLNPNAINPKTLKTLNPKAENTAYTQYFLQFLFSCSATGNPQCCSPGKPRGLCVIFSKSAWAIACICHE